MISVIISDNARNIVAAIKKGNLRNLGCFTHTVNLMAQKEIKLHLLRLEKQWNFSCLF